MSLAARTLLVVLVLVVVGLGWHVPNARPAALTTVSVAELRRMAERQEWTQLQRLGTQYAEWLRNQERLRLLATSAAAAAAAAAANSTAAVVAPPLPPPAPAAANGDALRVFGVAEYQLANLRRAHLFLELAVNASGGLAGAPVDLLHDTGLVALMLRKRAGETCLRHALVRDPHHLPTVLSLGAHLVSQGATEEALEIYEEAAGSSFGGGDDGSGDGGGDDDDAGAVGWMWLGDDGASAGAAGAAAAATIVAAKRAAVAESLAFRVNYALALNYAGLLEEMATVLQRSPDPRARLMGATAVWPIVPRSEAQVAFWRRRALAAAAAFRADRQAARGAAGTGAAAGATCFEYTAHAQVLRHLDHLDQSHDRPRGAVVGGRGSGRTHDAQCRDAAGVGDGEGWWDAAQGRCRSRRSSGGGGHADEDVMANSVPPVMVSVPEAVLLASNMGYYAPYHNANNRRLMVAFGQMFRCLAFAPSLPVPADVDVAAAAKALNEPGGGGLGTTAAAKSQWSVYADHTNDLRWSAQQQPQQWGGAAAGAKQKPRVLFLSGHLRNHTLGFLMHRLIEALPGLGYHVHIATCSKAMDEISTSLADAIAGGGGGYHILPCGANDGHRMGDALQALHRLAPDAIVFNDLSMDGASYLLAQYRLAPVQVLTMNNGLTSGLPNMDYYVSSDLAEPDGGFQDYTEQLVRLPGCMYACVDPPPGLPAAANASELSQWFDELGFGADLRHARSRIYLIPQTLFKLHPRFDAVIAAVLRGDPYGFVVLPLGAQPLLADQLRARLRRTVRNPSLLSRIRFVPGGGDGNSGSDDSGGSDEDGEEAGAARRQRRRRGFFPRGTFLKLLRVSAVVMDPAPFGGGLTSLEAFAAGTPVATLDGAGARRSGRLTAAMYRLMGLYDRPFKLSPLPPPPAQAAAEPPATEAFSCCVARTPEEYVDVALTLAGARRARTDARRQVVAAIEQQRAVLFGDRKTIDQWDRFLRRAIGQSRQQMHDLAVVQAGPRPRSQVSGS